MNTTTASTSSWRLLTFLVMCLTWGYGMAIEEPKYELIEKSGKLELRAYEPMIIAEVVVGGDMDTASRRGFRLLADYIFGNNSTPQGGAQKISMTAPVTMEPQSTKIAMTTPVTMESQNPDDNSWRVHFVMPAKYTMEQLPQPNNAQVQIKPIAAQKYAVIRFSGFSGEKKVARKTQELLSWAESQNYQVVGSPELARYNPPITPPFFRRNEVMVRIAD